MLLLSMIDQPHTVLALGEGALGKLRVLLEGQAGDGSDQHRHVDTDEYVAVDLLEARHESDVAGGATHEVNHDHGVEPISLVLLDDLKSLSVELVNGLTRDQTKSLNVLLLAHDHLCGLLQLDAKEAVRNDKNLVQHSE